MIREGNKIVDKDGKFSHFNYVIPVFNTPIDMLDRCVNSICQSLMNAGRSNWYEYLTIIDDCSAIDYSVKIEEEIVKKHKINYIRLPKNAGGLFWTRMEALRLLNLPDNDYVCFVDSDDEISLDYQEGFEKSFYLNGNNVDIYQMGLLEIKPYSERLHLNSEDKDVLVNTRWNLNGKFFKVKLFETAKKHEELKCFFGEDLIHSILMYPHIKRIIPCKEGRHIYYVREKTEAEGTEYRKDEEETKRKMEAYEKLIKRACELTGMKDPRNPITKDSKVLLIIFDIKDINDFNASKNWLFDHYDFLDGLFSGHIIKVNIRSTDPDKLFEYPQYFRADQYMQITDMERASKSLAKYYESFGCQMEVIHNGKFLTKEEFLEKFKNGNSI